MNAVIPLLTAFWDWLGLATSRALDGLGLLIEIVIEGPDLCASLFAWLVLFMIGNQLTNAIPDVRKRSGYLALGVFLVYAGRKFVIEFPADASDVLSILLRSLLAAAWVFVLALILFTVFAGIWQHTFGILGRLLLQSFNRAQKSYSEAIRRMTDAERIERLQGDAERLAPEREQRQRETEARARVEREATETACRRREEARLRSELSYERHARQLTASFPRERFEQFMERYLSNETPPDLVEQREQLLKEMIVDSLGTTTAPKFTSMNELAAFFEARRQEIAKLPHSDEIKDAYVVQLNKQEDDALKRFLKP